MSIMDKSGVFELKTAISPLVEREFDLPFPPISSHFPPILPMASRMAGKNAEYCTLVQYPDRFPCGVGMSVP